MALTFYWRCEEADFSAANGTTDYSAGDDIASANNSVSLDAAAAKYGSTGILVNAISEYYSFTPTSIISNSVGCLAFAFRLVNSMGVGDALFYARGTSSDDNVSIRIGSGGDELSLYIRQSGQSETELQTSAASLTTNTWYFVVARWDQPNNSRYIAVYDTDGTLIDDTGDLSTPYNLPNALNSAIRIGDSTGWGATKSVHFDNIFIGSAYDDPLDQNLTITSYAEYGAGGSSNGAAVYYYSQL